MLYQLHCQKLSMVYSIKQKVKSFDDGLSRNFTQLFGNVLLKNFECAQIKLQRKILSCVLKNSWEKAQFLTAERQVGIPPTVRSQKTWTDSLPLLNRATLMHAQTTMGLTLKM